MVASQNIKVKGKTYVYSIRLKRLLLKNEKYGTLSKNEFLSGQTQLFGIIIPLLWQEIAVTLKYDLWLITMHSWEFEPQGNYLRSESTENVSSGTHLIAIQLIKVGRFYYCFCVST